MNDGQGFAAPVLDAAAPGVATAIARVESWRELAAEKSAGRVPLSWTLGVIYAESLGRPSDVSPVGAVGLMQIMPMHARGRDLLDPRVNVEIGTGLLGESRAAGFDLPVSASIYNGGPSKLRKGPKQSTKSPWGMVENVGYIDRVVRANNYFIAGGAQPTSARRPSSAAPLLLLLLLAWKLAG